MKTKRISFLDCPHINVQSFSECCMDCGYNIYMTDEEYLRRLHEEVGSSLHEDAIRTLERKLGIG